MTDQPFIPGATMFKKILATVVAIVAGGLVVKTVRNSPRQIG